MSATADLTAYRAWLQNRERSPGTIAKYLRDTARFFAESGAPQPPPKAAVAAWRDALAARGYAPASVNAMLAAVNAYQDFCGNPAGKAKPLKCQRRIFCEARRELSRAEYFRLLDAARRTGRKRTLLVLQTLCATGIRVSELRFITAEAVRKGRAAIRCKGNTYTVVQADADKTLTNSAVVTGEDFPDDDPDTPPPQDEEEHEVKDDGKIKLQPAAITIYMGGKDGYEAVMNGNVSTSSNSLPEPGFYITLPGEVNQALGGNGHAADLSGKITVTAATTAGAERTWTLQKYGDSTSTALINDQEHFVYKIEPGKNQPAIRVAFTDNADNTVTSDAFTLTDNLSNEYKMNLYTGDVDVASISLKIEAGDQTFYCGYDDEGSTPGILTVRYAATDALITPATTDLDVEIANDTKQFYVEVNDSQKFYINDGNSQAGVTVDADSVSLLADNLTGNNDDYNEADLYAATQKATSFEKTVMFGKYFDLVDAQNGNAWLTSDQAVTVFWPYPAGTDKTTDFELFHFDGLDREGTAAAGASAIDDATPMKVTSFEKGEHGITFTTESFSPFVLVWENTQAEQPGDEDKPSGDDDNNNNNNNNNNTNNNQNKSTASASASASAAVTAPAAPAAAVIPQTGDEMPVGLLAGLALVAAGGLAALLVLRKRRSDR